MMRAPRSPLSTQSGALMMEIIVTIAVVIIGLWGLLDLQARLQSSEMESYQRTQALLLLNDMANRIESNRLDAASYVTATTQGAGMTCATPGVGAALEAQDEAEWCEALQGAAEQLSGTDVGALIGGRGCVASVGTGGVQEYMITVTWQGLTPVAAPPASITCGAGAYDLPAGSDCASAPEFCRRYVSTLVRIADLTDL